MSNQRTRLAWIGYVILQTVFCAGALAGERFPEQPFVKRATEFPAETEIMRVIPDNRCEGQQKRTASGKIYRGPRPDVSWLKKFDFTDLNARVISLEDWGAFKTNAASFGKAGYRGPLISESMPNFGLPVKGLSIDDSGIIESLALIASRGSKPTYIHCKFGKDRTGLIMALYRVLFECWAPDAARAEWYGLQGPLHATFQFMLTMFYDSTTRDPNHLAAFRARVNQKVSELNDRGLAAVNARGRGVVYGEHLDQPKQPATSTLVTQASAK